MACERLFLHRNPGQDCHGDAVPNHKRDDHVAHYVAGLDPDTGTHHRQDDQQEKGLQHIGRGFTVGYRQGDFGDQLLQLTR